MSNFDNDDRLIEDYIPITEISRVGAREKNVRRGHISTIHLWWARRPLVACRAAVFGSLVPTQAFDGVHSTNPQDSARTKAANFLKALCIYPHSDLAIKEAESLILDSHAKRQRSPVNAHSATAPVPRPRVLDMFAGGGAIPLEAARLGCDAYALDLNPVAHIIELCTLYFPQKYGHPRNDVHGAGRTNTWIGLANEVKHWGKKISEEVRAEVGDLYKSVKDKRKSQAPTTSRLWREAGDKNREYLTPIAYLWTRVVDCKNPSCKGPVPLAKQTWLCKKENRYVAFRIIASKKSMKLRFEVVETTSPDELEFNPDLGSTGGNATCLFCGTVADSDYVKNEGCAGRMRQLPTIGVFTRAHERGKVYLSATDVPECFPGEADIQSRIAALCQREGLTVPSETISTDAKNSCWTHLYGLKSFADLFTPRQLLVLLAFTASIRRLYATLLTDGYEAEMAKAIVTCLGCVLDKQVDLNSSLCMLKVDGGRGIVHTFGRQALPMVWDFAEANPFQDEIASWSRGLDEVAGNLEDLVDVRVSSVHRGTATALPWEDGYFDAVITDPPYYDNVPYSNISDFFYVWLKRSVGHLYPEHFAVSVTPKKNEAVADATRHGGSRDRARSAYEQMMADALKEARRVLKEDGILIVVYAHKTTLGWATLVEALRRAGFAVTEAWPLDTETSGRLRAQESSSLASSIFLVARRRSEQGVGRYDEVRPELDEIVKERVSCLWDLGISGADLVIACVGAGLRAFTRYSGLEYANGEEVPAERFLSEVETVVLETILSRLSREVGGVSRYALASVDSATRFYILWRYTYKAADLDSGEAIIFANGTHVELDGLAANPRALVKKKSGDLRLLDYADRGDDAKLGSPSEDGQPAPLIDILHRLLWLMERHPSGIPDFLREARPNKEQLRLVAQALAGPALKGGELNEVATGSELSALTKLTSNWNSVVEDADLTSVERKARRVGQGQLQLD
jgi:putative DNA methylase